MNGWNQLSLSEFGKVARGKSKHRPRNDPKLYGGDYPFIQTADVKNANFYINNYSQTYNENGLKQSKLWGKDTLCITIAANIAESALLSFPACFPDSIVGFTPYKGKSDVRYVKYMLDNYKSEFQKRSKGATQDNLSVSKINSLKMSIPSYDYQIQIADLISTYDTLVENNQKRIKVLEEMAQRLYAEWFVKFKFPDYEEVKMVDSGSEYGIIPEGWGVKRFRETIEYYIGGGWGKEFKSDDFPKSAFVIRGTDIPEVSIGNIVNVPHRFHKVSNFTSREIKENDLVFEVSGGSKKQSVGRTCVINKNLLSRFDGKVMCASFCKLVRPKKSFQYYIYLSLQSMYDKGIMDLYQIKSTGISNFKFEEFLDYQPILIPNLVVLTKFTDTTKVWYKQIQVLGEKNAKLKNMRDLLIENLVTGKRLLKEEI